MSRPHSSPSTDRALPMAVLAQLALLTAGWGGNAPALRFSLAYLPPIAAAGLRFGIALFVIYAAARWRRVPLFTRLPWGSLAILSLMFTAQISLLNLGSPHTSAGRQALLLNSYPLFVPVLAHFFVPGDRLTWHKVGGTLLAFFGVLFLLGERAAAPGGQLRGDLLIAGSALLLSGIAIYASRLVQRIHSYQVLFWQMAFAVPLFFALSLAMEPQRYVWSPLVGVSLAYQGIIVAGLCFLGWTSLMERYSPSRLSVGFFMTPAFGAFFSYLLLREKVTQSLVIAGMVIFAGLILVTRSPAGKETGK